MKHALCSTLFRASSLVAVGLGFTTGLQAQGAKYTVEVLGTGFPVAMNELGEAVGWVSVGGSPRGWVATAAGQTVLPIPSGMLSSRARDINDAGVIVGHVSDGIIGDIGYAVAWVPNGTGYDINSLTPLAGYTYSSATAINDLGDIVGESVSASWATGPATLFTDPSGPVNLGALGLIGANDINDQRQVVGGQYRLDLDTMVLENLGLPPSPPNYWWTRANAISEDGRVAGNAHLATSGNSPLEVARYVDGAGWEILSPPGALNNAYGINSQGTVMLEYGVGAAMIVAIYEDGLGLRPLSTVMAPGYEDWLFSSVFSGNGQSPSMYRYSSR